MKKLLLIRHAKAEKEPAAKDIDRPLKYTGIQDARFMAGRIKENSLVPQMIITSPALRTKTTAEIFADELLLPEPHTEPLIYAATWQNLLKVINQLPNEYHFIALVGHNPGMGIILSYLTGVTREVHTCTVAFIEFETDEWATISQGEGSLTYYSSPME